MAGMTRKFSSIRFRTAVRLVVLCCLSANLSIAHASPCDDVDQKLAQDERAPLESTVAQQLDIQSAEILKSFYYHGWRIVYVNTHVSDETFLFYRGDPSKSKYVTTWSGGAKTNEEAEVRRWVVENASGIPTRLAACFAWYVTKGRNL